MDILRDLYEKGKQIVQGIAKAIEKIKGAIKFFMSTVRNYCWYSDTRSCCVSFSSSIIEDGRALFRKNVKC